MNQPSRQATNSRSAPGLSCRRNSISPTPLRESMESSARIITIDGHRLRPRQGNDERDQQQEGVHNKHAEPRSRIPIHDLWSMLTTGHESTPHRYAQFRRTGAFRRRTGSRFLCDRYSLLALDLTCSDRESAPFGATVALSLESASPSRRSLNGQIRWSARRL